MNDRQKAILDAIRGHWASHGCSPGLQDLCNAFGYASVNGIVHHLRVMRDAGLIEWEPKLSRQLWPAGLRQRIKDAARV